MESRLETETRSSSGTLRSRAEEMRAFFGDDRVLLDLLAAFLVVGP
jgi:hypothetical protein